MCMNVFVCTPDRSDMELGGLISYTYKNTYLASSNEELRVKAAAKLKKITHNDKIQFLNVKYETMNERRLSSI